MKFVISLFCLIFGLMTLKEGGSVLFVDGADRQAAGHYVPWVLWFNFLTGFALLAASGGFWFRRHWTRRLTIAVATLSLMILIGFLILVATGGAYETRTLIAMPLRTAIWTGLAFYAARVLHKKSGHSNYNSPIGDVMKTIICILFLLVTTTSTIWADAHHHASPQGKAAASHGRKFPADANLKTQMEAILTAFNSLAPSGEATSTSKDAGHKIEATVKQIFATCKLAPDADTAIHPLLTELLAGASSLKKGQLKTGKRKIGQALANYGRLFDHEGWKQQ